MRGQAAEPCASGAKGPWQGYWMPAAVLLIGLGSIALFLWVNGISERQRQHSLAADAVMDIQINTATAHLWLEEAVSGDAMVDVGEILAELDRAAGLARVLLEGGESEHGSLPQPLRDPQLRAQAEALRSLVVQFKRLAVERLQNQETAGIGSVPEQQFDVVFREILGTAAVLEEIIEQHRAADRAQSGRLFLLILCAWAFIVAATSAALWGHERRRRGAEEALRKAHAQLFSQAQELSRHREHLTELVEMRTAELTAANALLRGEIDERRRTEAALEQKARELARSNAELEQFAYVASHDLQEPLRMVASFVQLLERRYRGRLDGEADEYIAFAVEGAARMKRLLNDLLAFCRAGAAERPMRRVEGEAALARAMESLRGAIEQSGAVITHDPLPEVTADGPQMVRLFAHLLDNAIKFRGQEALRVHVGVEKQDGAYLFGVADNGMGVAPPYAEKIFRLFQRLNARERYPGNGIGLAECKKIVERHGGRIWVESAPGQGATFRFTMPCTESGADGEG